MGEKHKKKSIKSGITQQADNTLVNMMKERDQVKRFKKAVIELVEQTKFLTKQDVGKWRQAWQRAISVEYPSRVELNAVYRDIAIDSHLIGVIGQILTEVLQKDFLIVDRTSDDELDDQKKTLDDAQWFIDYCTSVIYAEFEGFRLVEFGDVVTVNGIMKFTEVDVVDSDHVIPEYSVFVENRGDHPNNGYNFNEPPYNSMCIGIGRKRNLGLYNAVAPHALAKKNVLAFWDKFAEIFGMPLRIGKTNSSNPKDRNEISEMLQKMGAAAWGMFPDGTGIEIKETTRGDAYEVYDKRVERANSEMSKAIVHQTMTTDNGSSKSQSETHLTIQEKVIEYFARLLRININDKLIPFMVLNGFKGWENAKFRYNDTVEYSVDEQVKIEEMLLRNFEITDETVAHFSEKYNIPGLALKKVKEPQPPFPTNGFFD